MHSRSGRGLELRLEAVEPGISVVAVYLMGQRPIGPLGGHGSVGDGVQRRKISMHTGKPAGRHRIEGCQRVQRALVNRTRRRAGCRGDGRELHADLSSASRLGSLQHYPFAMNTVVMTERYDGNSDLIMRHSQKRVLSCSAVT